MKPENFRCNKDGFVYILDFGLTMEYMNMYEEHKTQGYFGFQGTPFCASINSLDGSTMSRRDDIESLAYSIMQLVDVTLLPWYQINDINQITKIKKEFEKEPDEKLVCHN